MRVRQQWTSSFPRLGGGVFFISFESITMFPHNKGWWRMSKLEKYASPSKYVNYQRQ